MPDVGILRELWETPNLLNETVYYRIPHNESMGNFSIYESIASNSSISLWVGVLGHTPPARL